MQVTRYLSILKVASVKMLGTMKVVFGIIGGIASIIDVVLLVLFLPIAATIDLGGNIDIKFFTMFIKVIGILFVISVVACAITALL